MSLGNRSLFIAVSAAAGIAVASSILRSRRRYEFADKVVLITGGSRGLGLVMARELVARGAHIAICARDKEELARAAADLRAYGTRVFTIACDVREKSAVEDMVASVTRELGPVDVLINNAGVIQVGPLEVQTQKDFEDAMNIHYWAPYFTMNAVIPSMRERGDGRIINISSIGGKIAVPHLAPYCASKFALAGLSTAMHAELAKDNISVTTVYPGLMRTGSHINALFKGQNGKEFALFSIANGLPLSSISAESAARQIINAAAEGKAEIVVSVQAKAAVAFQSLMPEILASILAVTNKVLPGEGGIGSGYATGLESTSDASPSILTSLVDAASQRNNELKPNESI